MLLPTIAIVAMLPSAAIAPQPQTISSRDVRSLVTIRPWRPPLWIKADLAVDGDAETSACDAGLFDIVSGANAQAPDTGGCPQ